MQNLVNNSVAAGRHLGASRPTTNPGTGVNNGNTNVGVRNGGQDIASANLQAPPTSSIPVAFKRPTTDFVRNSAALSTFTSVMTPFAAGITPYARWWLPWEVAPTSTVTSPTSFPPPAKFDPGTLNRAPNLLSKPLPPGFAFMPEKSA